MKPENQKQLKEIAGPIFPEFPTPKTNLMCFGFDVNDGWFEIIKQCLTDLRTLHDKGVAPNLLLQQVKEKFGGLRIYVSGYDEGGIVEAVLSRAERLSFQTCEECGSDYAKLRKGGWLQTLCDSHAKGREPVK